MKQTNQQWIERRNAAVPRGLSNACAIYADRRECGIVDVEGRRYIDFAGGSRWSTPATATRRSWKLCRLSCAASPHSVPVVPYDSYILLAERLNKLAPIPGQVKTILLSTGAEAIENAVKIARAYTGRPGVIAFSGPFMAALFSPPA